MAALLRAWVELMVGKHSLTIVSHSSVCHCVFAGVAVNIAGMPTRTTTRANSNRDITSVTAKAAARLFDSARSGNIGFRGLRNNWRQPRTNCRGGNHAAAGNFSHLGCKTAGHVLLALHCLPLIMVTLGQPSSITVG